MPAKQRRRRQVPDLATNIASDALSDELRRVDQRPTPPDSLPPPEQGGDGDEPAGGGFTPRADGGNAQHPIHDEDREDATPSDYEREIARIDTVARFDR